MTRIFVYGSLKRGGSNHRYLAGQKFLGETRTAPGYTLYSLGDYPGMVPSTVASDDVTGELWAIDAVCLAKLDVLEGLAEGLYARVSIELTPPFAGQSAETYLYLRSLAGCVPVGSHWPV
jgi:gamma-glutamylaminecyclotransferase